MIRRSLADYDKRYGKLRELLTAALRADGPAIRPAMEKDASGPLQELLADRYRIDQELGRGGYATVYRVWNPRLERGEALKVLAPGHQVDEDFSRRFPQEVRLAAALEHPSIVKVYDFGENGGSTGTRCSSSRTDPSGEVRERGPLRERETARIAIPLLEALEYSHARGIVHRDIKPENIILDREGRPFLMDFGIAKSAGSLVKTQTGFLLGTPAYVAPEQAQGKKLDGRADLYALGVTLYKTVSGAYPFEASDPLQAVILRLTQPPRPLGEARPGSRPGFRQRRHAGPRARAGGSMGFRARDAGRARRLPRGPAAGHGGDARSRIRGPGRALGGPGPAARSRLLGPVAPPSPPSREGHATRALRRRFRPGRPPSRRSYVVPLAVGVRHPSCSSVGGTGLALFRTGRNPSGTNSPPAG